MTVLCLSPGPENYGIRRLWLTLTNGLKRQGSEPIFAVLSRGGIGDDMESRGVTVVYPSNTAPLPPVNARHGARKVVQFASRARRHVRVAAWLAQQVRIHGAKAIIVRSPLEATLAAVAARFTGITAYWMMPNAVSANYPLDINRRVYRFLFRHMNLVPVANSNYTDASLGPGDFRRHVVHLGIDVSEFSPDRPTTLTRADLGIPDHAVVFGIFARMVPDKGQLVFLQALASLSQDVEDAHLLLCGGPTDTAYAQSIKAFAGQTGLSCRVHLAGHIEDIAPYNRLCDIAVNSRLIAEPFGFSVIEAMAMGKPVLAHRLGGPSETILDGVTGWLVDDPTPASFAAAIRRALDDRPRWPDMSRSASEHSKEHFNVQRMLRDLTSVFDVSEQTVT